MDLSSNSNCPPTPPHLSACPPTPTRPNALLKSNPSRSTPSEESSNEGRLSNISENADGRGSPPPNCAICLYKCTNKCFTDSCLHQFCFTCLLQWSKVKPECPLCKQSFKSIIHNVKSNDDYEEYLVRPSMTTIAEPLLLTNYHLPHSDGQRFQFRTTFNLHRREEMALQNYFLEHPLTNNFVLSPNPFYDLSSVSRPRPTFTRRHRRRNLDSSNGEFRATVYRNNLWALPLPDITGRFRDSSAHFYRNNPAQIHRLFPWLDRELKVLLNENQPHISYVMNIISELIPVRDIVSAEFRSTLQSYFTDNTGHFIHELYQFARSPFDMVGYDRDVQYVSHEFYVEHYRLNITSSTSDTDDSDVRIISPDITERNNENSIIYVNDESTSVMLTSEPTDLSLPRNNQIDSLVSIETVCPSDTDDDSDACVITGVLKPPQDRTPEIITLNSDNNDTDVISVHSDELKSELSLSSGELYTQEIEMPSTSRVWSSNRKKLINDNKKPASVAYESSDSDPDFNLPLILHKRRSVSEKLLNRFRSIDEIPPISLSSSSSDDNRSKNQRKINKKKGKSLIRNTNKRKPLSKMLLKKRKWSTSSESLTTQEHSDSNSSNSNSRKKLRSVVIKKTEAEDDLTSSPVENMAVFNENLDNDDHYTVVSSYYNNPVTMPCEHSPVLQDSSSVSESASGPLTQESQGSQSICDAFNFWAQLSEDK